MDSRTTKYGFPDLRPGQILQCMSEMGIELNKAELMEPHRHKARVQQVFLKLLEVCCSLSEDAFTIANARPSDVEGIDHPQLYEDAFSEVKFFKELHFLMESCMVDDFGLRDLHAPTTERFRRQLCAIINMAKFRESQLPLLAELSEPRVDLLAQLEEVIGEHQQLSQHLEETKIVSSSQSKEILELADDCTTLEREIARNNKHQISIRQEVAVLKKKSNDLVDDNATAALALEEAQAEEKSLLSQVVSSPERRKNDLSTKRDFLDQERKACAEVEEQAAIAKTKIVNVRQAQQDCEMVTALAGEVEERINEHSVAMEQIHAKEEEVESKETQTSKLVLQKEECEQDLHRIEERIAHFRKQSKVKMDAAQESLESARSQLLVVEKGRMDGIARVKAGEAEVRAIEAEIEEDKKHTDKEIADAIAEYRETEKAILEEEARFLTAIRC